jgi:hypothetical protein
MSAMRSMSRPSVSASRTRIAASYPNPVATTESASAVRDDGRTRTPSRSATPPARPTVVRPRASITTPTLGRSSTSIPIDTPNPGYPRT